MEESQEGTYTGLQNRYTYSERYYKKISPQNQNFLDRHRKIQIEYRYSELKENENLENSEWQLCKNE